MKSKGGASVLTLVISLVIVIIIALIFVRYGKNIAEETKLQDLRTNMLLIQADAKKDLEEVCFQTANLSTSKEEDLNKIKEIKKEYIKGVLVQESDILNEIPYEISVDENCYYINEAILNEIGVKDIEYGKDGYFIVKYDFSNITVEVINTKGYDGKYTLTQLVEE